MAQKSCIINVKWCTQMTYNECSNWCLSACMHCLNHCKHESFTFCSIAALILSCSYILQLSALCLGSWTTCVGLAGVHVVVSPGFNDLSFTASERCRISVDTAVVTVNWKEGKRMWGKVWRIEGKTLVNRKHQFKIISCLLHCYAPFICLTKHFCWFRLHYSLFNNNMLHAST